MSYTEQQKALEELQKLFGRTAFTQHYQNYKRVGFHPTRKVTLSAIGETYEVAVEALKVKVDQWATE